jgi:hypothetical protein
MRPSAIVWVDGQSQSGDQEGDREDDADVHCSG